MRRSALAAAILVGAATVMPTAYANAQDFHAKLSGFKEVGGLNAETGAIFTPGQGTLKLKLNTKLQSVNWTLTYSNVSASVTQAHIHFGKEHVPGGIMVFFCTNLGNGPVGTQACPSLVAPFRACSQQEACLRCLDNTLQPATLTHSRRRY